MAYKRMLEDNFYRCYAVAISYFEEQNFKACDDWLQKLSLLILSQEELNSDFFLAIQNTRALCSIALQKFPEARKILNPVFKRKLTLLSGITYSIISQ